MGLLGLALANLVRLGSKDLLRRPSISSSSSVSVRDAGVFKDLRSCDVIRAVFAIAPGFSSPCGRRSWKILLMSLTIWDLDAAVRKCVVQEVCCCRDIVVGCKEDMHAIVTGSGGSFDSSEQRGRIHSVRICGVLWNFLAKRVGAVGQVSSQHTWMAVEDSGSRGLGNHGVLHFDKSGVGFVIDPCESTKGDELT